MARLKIIVLHKDGDKLYFALWADVPVERQPFYVNATKVSAWKNAIAADNTALQDGSVVEKVAYIDVSGAGNLAAIKAELIAQWTGFQNEINAANPWKWHGTTYAGTTWTNGGVA